MRSLVTAFVASLVIAIGIAGVDRSLHAAAPLRIVTTTEDLASLVRSVGGDKVIVVALAKGYQDPHFVDPKPSFLLEMSRANLLVVVGRDLELGWLPPLITSSRNPKIQPGGAGYLDASRNVRMLEIPTGQITRAMGDVHPLGNPHYWLEPGNGRRMAQTIRDTLIQLDAAGRPYFEQRYTEFDQRLAAAEKRWDATMAPYRGARLVTYHRSWPNFMDRWGLNVIGYVEPKPGIPPTTSHTVALISEMKRQGVKLIVVEPYFDDKTPRAIASQVGGEVIKLAPSVGGAKEATDYIQLFEHNVNMLAAAFKRTTGK